MYTGRHIYTVLLALDQVDEVGCLTGGGNTSHSIQLYPEVLLVNLYVAIREGPGSSSIWISCTAHSLGEVRVFSSSSGKEVT